MPRSFIKNIVQEIRHSLGRFLSILCIVAIGVAFFAGIKASAPDMKNSADTYFDSYNVQDIQVYSTLGLTDKDIDAIQEINGVKDVQAIFSMDTLTRLESSELVIKVFGYNPDQTMNTVRLVDGRMPENENECIVQATSATSELYGGFEIGDTIQLYVSDDDSLSDSLKNDTYTIVGTCYNPNYLSYELGSSSIGSGSVNSFIYVLDDNIVADYYTEIDVTVDGGLELNSYDDAYFDLVEPIVKKIENIADDQIQVRIQENQDIVDQAQKKLDRLIDKAQKKIDDGQKEIDEGEQEIINSEAKLASAKTQLNDGWEQYYSNYALLDNIPTIEEGISKIEEGESQLTYLNTLKEQLEQGISSLEAVIDNLEQLNTLKETSASLDALIQSGTLPDEELAVYLQQKMEIDYSIEYMETMLEGYTIEQTKSEIETYQTQLDTINNNIHQIEMASRQKEALIAQRDQLLDAKVQLAQSYQTLCASQAEYESGLAQLEEAKQTLNSAKVDLEDAKTQLQNEKKEHQKEIDDAQEEIDALEGEWIVLDRNSHYSYRDYGACADRMDGIAKVFPVFFFLVAALVCMTTMTRMVDEQRLEIGTLKALGYSKTQIASKYLIYAFVASVFGSIFGCAIGMVLFPTVIFSAWNMLYNLESIVYQWQPSLMLLAGGSVTGITLLATIYSIQAELKDVPSQLMRPKSGKAGKKILLERIPLIWNHLSFLQKVTARNIFRYKKRFYMTIIGIAGCSALLVAGFGINDSISDIVNQQYNNIYHYNASVSLKRSTDAIDSLEGVEETFVEEQLPVTVNMEDKDYNVTVHVIDDVNRFKDFTTLTSTKDKSELELDDSSVVISQKMAERLNVDIGDTFVFTDANDMEITCTVSGIYKNYVGHHMFVTRKMVKSWKSSAKRTKTCLIKTESQESLYEEKLGNQLMNLKEVKSVTFYSSLQKNFQNMISSLSMVVILLVVSAAALAFVVLYNLSNVNISERIREIATIKVLGFLPNEVSAYVNRESTILTMIGALISLGIGIGLHHIIMNLAEMDDVMFGRTIKPISFVISFIMTIFFSILINTFMKHKLRQVKMVESLKAVE